MRVTLKDIALKAGVTKAAVSFALRASPHVSLKTRERICHIAEEMGYVADPILRRLAEYRSTKSSTKFQSVIAWMNHWNNPKRLRSYHEFEQCWRGAKLASKRLGYRLVEFVWPANYPAKWAEQKLLNQCVLGLLIPPHPPDVDWYDFGWNNFSLMRFGMSVRRPDSNLVAADHQRAMVAAMQTIWNHGYHRIGLIYNREHDHSMGGNYYGGFLWAHKFLNVQQLIPPLDSEAKTPKLAARSKNNLKIWMKKYKPDAIITASPETLVFLRELGYRIPSDIAVASTSPYDISVDAGIDQCPNTIGQIAAEMLIKQISLNERGEPSNPCRILVESRWKDGRSLPPRKPVG